MVLSPLPARSASYNGIKTLELVSEYKRIGSLSCLGSQNCTRLSRPSEVVTIPSFVHKTRPWRPIVSDKAEDFVLGSNTYNSCPVPANKAESGDQSKHLHDSLKFKDVSSRVPVPALDCSICTCRYESRNRRRSARF